MRAMSALICTSVLSSVLMLTVAGAAGAATLVADGAPQAVIVTPDEPSETVELAVDELNYWIERITGTTLPVVAHGDWDGEGTVVAVGASPFTEARGLDVSDLGPEGALVAATEEYVALLGRDEAPVETV
ncbi:MAG: hypothetical protein ACQER1_10190, partial [Armatimonadota bacterium]